MLRTVRKGFVSDDAIKVKSDGAATYGDKLLVSGVLAVSGEHGDQSLLSVKSLKDLVESLNKSYSVDNSRIQSIMPSILVQIMALAQSQEQAPVPTVISLRLLDHTLDGIIDVVGLLFFLDLLNFNFLLAIMGKNKRNKGEKTC